MIFKRKQAKAKPVDEQGWQRTLPILTRTQAVNLIDTLTERGFETQGPRLGSNENESGDESAGAAFLVKYRPMKKGRSTCKGLTI